MTAPVQHASDGVGPLLQRDYWAVFADCDMKPSALVAHVKAHFCELPPASLVSFSTCGDIVHGGELDIVIRPAQHCQVRVIHEDAQSITLGTLDGHPEAGRITFGAYRNPAGDVIFHIRSRARAANTPKLLGFLAVGEAMQTNTWTGFINNTAVSVKARIVDVIHADTERVDEMMEDGEPADAHGPTFLAVGD